MNKLGRLVVFLALALGLAGGAWFLWQNVLSGMFKSETEVLALVDAALSRKDWKEAKSLLGRQPQVPSSQAQAYKWISRARSYAGFTLDWEPLAVSAQILDKTFPGSSVNPDVLGLTAWAFMRAGWKNQALEKAAELEKIPSEAVQEKYGPLVREVFIRFSLGGGEVGMGPQAWARVKTLLSDRTNPELYKIYSQLSRLFLSASALQAMAVRTNAALLYLEKGEYSQAKAYLEGPGKVHLTPGLLAHYYYDTGDWNQAEYYLSTLDTTAEADSIRYSLLRADNALQNRNPSLAQEIYQKIIHQEESVPGIRLASSVPYLNLATILEMKGHKTFLNQALSLLRRNAMVEEGRIDLGSNDLENLQFTLEKLSQDTREAIRLFRAELIFKTGKSEDTRKMLSRENSSLDEELLRYRLFPEMLSLPRLLTQFSQGGSGAAEERLTEFLVWTLLVSKQYKEARNRLDQWEQRIAGIPTLPGYNGSRNWWIRNYRALAWGLEGEYEKALDELAQIEPKYMDFYYFYNRGVLHGAGATASEYLKALDQWEAARSWLAGSGQGGEISHDREYSRLYGSMAAALEVLARKAQDEEKQVKAREYAALALELDPSNHGAYLVIQRLGPSQKNTDSPGD